eukprot:TRINITY_DN1607_c1_g1_i1.p1 TRINITY_DN1607_c1_g1~~TRINITY_DN1607_c1_g1_i1.p1  ORF type:complete len:484 (-),score=120.38 TRINITY_DN1607_c1_g1_i1:135-1586(-)
MEAALRMVIEQTFGDFVENLHIDASKFPLELKNLKLKEKRIQEELDEDGGFPFDITDGRIGQITVHPGWMGDCEVTASGIVLNFTFNPMKAMKAAMRPNEDGMEEEQIHGPSGGYGGHPGVPLQQRAPPPGPPVPPRYCSRHATSEQRVKVEPRMVECANCQLKVQTNYQDFKLCPNCSDKTASCMLCGSHAPQAGDYVPQGGLVPQGGPGGPSDRGPHEQGPGGYDRYGKGGPPSPSGKGGKGKGFESFRGISSDGFGSGLPPPPPPPPNRSAQSSARDRDFSRDFGSAPPAPPTPGGKGGFKGGKGGKGGPDRMESGMSGMMAPGGKGGFGNSFNGAGSGFHGGPGTDDWRPTKGAPPGGGFGGRPPAGPGKEPPRGQKPSQGGGLSDLLSGNIFNFPILDIGSWANCMNSPGEVQDGQAGNRRALNSNRPPNGPPNGGGFSAGRDPMASQGRNAFSSQISNGPPPPPPMPAGGQPWRGGA